MQRLPHSIVKSLILVSLSTPLFANTISKEAFLHSWTASALKLQREIDLNSPLYEATFLGTHNSYNAKAYTIPLVRYLDPNQTLSLYDQLEMGARSIELDIHWTMTKHFSKHILLCHAKSSHIGCSVFDREFEDGLKEIRKWIQENPKEVILIYLERYLDGNESKAAAALDKYLGEFIFKPSAIRKSTANQCLSLPTTFSKADILKSGKQILIVAKGCEKRSEVDNGMAAHSSPSWNDYVFAGIGKINKPYTFIDALVSKFSVDPDCSQSSVFKNDKDHSSLWRIFEDRTMLTDVVHPEKKLLDQDMRDLMHCGINWPSVDMLSIDDSRLKAAIWSWAPDYPKAQQGQCAIYKRDAGIENIACISAASGFACQEKNSKEMKVLPIAGSWEQGEQLCQQSFGSHWHFTTPANKAQMDRLKTSMATVSLSEVWLNYAMDNTGQWVNLTKL